MRDIGVASVQMENAPSFVVDPSGRVAAETRDGSKQLAIATLQGERE